MMKRALGCCVAATLAACSATPPTGQTRGAYTTRATVPQTDNPYTLFESLQVRPLALSPSGKLLFAANTPDNRLEIFAVSSDGLQPLGSVAVGLEPVAVAAHGNNQVWVVNHLSDSVSIVDVHDPAHAAVVRTLAVGDEPRDIVFAGPEHNRAFITTAHRGQRGDDPDLFNPQAGRADVWVFDVDHLGSAAGGTRLAKLTLFADTPRALAASPDGRTVYAAAYFSGNQTTVVSVDAVRHVHADWMATNPDGSKSQTVILYGGQPQPLTGLVVKYVGGHWLDAYGANYDQWVTISLPDDDVFAIDAAATPPVAKADGVYPHVGTTLFNAAVNPVDGKIYVSNTDAHNDVRFEGHNPTLPVTSVRGNEVDSRITVIDPASKAITAANLNPHLDHAAGTGDASLSRAFPQDLVVSRDGKRLYVVAQGSAKLAVYDTAAIERGVATPTAANQVLLSAGGPAGVVLDEKNGRAYVLTRFDDGISTVSLADNREIAHRTMFNPEPKSVTDGRRYLYDATFTSALGDQACASCHVGGDFDGLAWDLGNPGMIPLGLLPYDQAAAKSAGTPLALASVFAIPPIFIEQLVPGSDQLFVAYMPMKGPMTTQSLRGLDNHGGMHWRGDRNGSIQQDGTPFIDPSTGQPVLSAQPDKGIFDEVNAFNSFNVAFPGLVGRDAELTTADMTAFTTFALQITYPPNPIRALDDSLTAEQQTGEAFFFNHDTSHPEIPSDRFHNCNGCHTTDRNGNLGHTAHPGFFGTQGLISFENEPQLFKVPHLRNLYQKVGMFGSAVDQNFVATLIPQLNPPLAAVRGFGFQHDGALGKLEDFFTGQVFVKTLNPSTIFGVPVPPNPGGVPLFTFDADGNMTQTIDPAGLALRHAIDSFLFAFDSNMKPIVGQQTTLTRDDASAAAADLALLESQASAGHCDLVVKALVAGQERGWVWSNGAFVPSVSTQPSLSDAQLRALVGSATASMTFTAVPPGSGWRVGVDRDGDGFADGDELAAGTNPADPESHP